MGHYHRIVNLTQRTAIVPMDVGVLDKLLEFGHGSGSAMGALWLLLGREAGAATESPSWVMKAGQATWHQTSSPKPASTAPPTTTARWAPQRTSPGTCWLSAAFARSPRRPATT